MRVPVALEGHYGKQFIRKSLGTSDPRQAAREADVLAKRYLSEFKALTSGSKMTPAEVSQAGVALAAQYDLEQFIDYVINPAREALAKGDQDLYDDAHPTDYLAPYQVEAWKVLSNPESFKLSDALTLYFKTHQRGANEPFIKKTKRDWDTLIATVGNIEFQDLSRTQARLLIDRLLNEGKRTSTVRRTLNTLGAVVSAAIRELEVTRTNPFDGQTIQGEGKDTKEKVVAAAEQLPEIVEFMRPKTSNAVALMTLLQMELGTRIGEVSGLSVDDVFLDSEVPHVFIRAQPWRSLKTDVSERKVPVVGVALDAIKSALQLPRSGKGLFDQYAHERGNDSASAAVNKALRPWGLTSHSLRHGMKDRLREVGCPQDLRDAIQGHTSGNIAEQYGHGHTLKSMQVWLEKVAVPLI